MALVIQERWGEVEPFLRRLDLAGARGSALATAVATAARDEVAGGRSRKTSHRELRALGYVGLSETLAFRSTDLAVR